METVRKRVLVVDDQADERSIQSAMLQHLGYEVQEAGGGEAGLEAAVEFPPDLVLLDVAMPRVDGITVCRQLRSDPRTRDVRIILFTASSASELRARAAAVGADSLLVKPLDPKRVATEIQRLIGPPFA